MLWLTIWYEGFTNSNFFFYLFVEWFSVNLVHRCDSCTYTEWLRELLFYGNIRRELLLSFLKRKILFFLNVSRSVVKRETLGAAERETLLLHHDANCLNFVNLWQLMCVVGNDIYMNNYKRQGVSLRITGPCWMLASPGRGWLPLIHTPDMHDSSVYFMLVAIVMLPFLFIIMYWGSALLHKNWNQNTIMYSTVGFLHTPC